MIQQQFQGGGFFRGGGRGGGRGGFGNRGGRGGFQQPRNTQPLMGAPPPPPSYGDF